MIAFFHTLDKNIEKFEQLAQHYAPGEQVKHFVNDAILKDALSKGFVSQETQQLFESEIQAIAAQKPTQIICTCSTFGEACKQLSEKGTLVKRIDYPIANYLVKKYTKIGLAYTAGSTKSISRNLLLEAAAEIKKNIEIVELDCSSSWHFFPQGNIEAYETSIANTVQQNAQEVEAIFLAQASMEGAKKHLHLNIEVVSSPEFGVEYYLKENQ